MGSRVVWWTDFSFALVVFFLLNERVMASIIACTGAVTPHTTLISPRIVNGQVASSHSEATSAMLETLHPVGFSSNSYTFQHTLTQITPQITLPTQTLSTGEALLAEIQWIHGHVIRQVQMGFYVSVRTNNCFWQVASHWRAQAPQVLRFPTFSSTKVLQTITF
jgi:hypothetical protein